MTSDSSVNASIAAIEPVEDGQLEAAEINSSPEREEATSENRKSALPAAIPVEDELKKFQEGIDQLIDAAEINSSPGTDDAASKDRKSALLYSSILLVLASGRAVLEPGGSVSRIPLAGLHFSMSFLSILLVLWAVSTYYLSSFLIASYRLRKRWELRREVWLQRAESLLLIPRRQTDEALESAEQASEENQQAQSDFQDWIKRHEHRNQFLDKLGSLLREAFDGREAHARVLPREDITPQFSIERQSPLDRLVGHAVQTALDASSMTLEPNDRDKIINILRRNLDRDQPIDNRISRAIGGIKYYWKRTDPDSAKDVIESYEKYEKAKKAFTAADRNVELVRKTGNIMQRSYSISIIVDVLFPFLLYIGALIALIFWLRSLTVQTLNASTGG
jgi:hypothetical protein